MTLVSYSLVIWWLDVVTWLERRYAPYVFASRARLQKQEADVTRLEELVDRIWRRLTLPSVG